MSHLVQFTRIYPDGWLPEGFPPEEATPGERFEGYEAILVDTPPQIGDRHTVDGMEWEVAEVYSYQPVVEKTEPLSTLYTAICHTLGDIERPTRNDWINNPVYGYFHLTDDGQVMDEGFGFFFNLKHISSCVKPQEGWQLARIQAFLPEGNRPIQGFDQIFVYWCQRQKEAIAA